MNELCLAIHKLLVEEVDGPAAALFSASFKDYSKDFNQTKADIMVWLSATYNTTFYPVVNTNSPLLVLGTNTTEETYVEYFKNSIVNLLQ